MPSIRQLSVRLLLLLLVGIGLVLMDAAVYRVGLPVTITATDTTTMLAIGSQQIVLPPSLTPPVRLTFPSHDPVIHEYQLDGTDSTNNFTLDIPYLHAIAASPYYRLTAWMRNLDGTSRWNDLRINDGRKDIWLPITGDIPVTLPNVAEHSFRVTMTLSRPETPTNFVIGLADGSDLHVTLNRNDRFITSIYLPADGGSQQVLARVFFPTDAAPFAAMVAATIIRILLGALLLIIVVIVGDSLGVCLLLLTATPIGTITAGWRELWRQWVVMLHWLPATLVQGRYSSKWVQQWWRRLTIAIHPIALVALGCSFIFVCWTALVQYNGQPHIYDASAYLFGAKMYAHGTLAVPIPAAADRFPGPFMLDYRGQRFTQYIPGTSLTLAVGVLLHLPWIIEPLLGTLALLGIGLVAYQLLQRRTVATLAVILGCVSPFYSYLAASYMSHAIALCYLVWGCWSLVRFAQGGKGVNVIAAALLWGMAWLTRDQISLLFIGIVVFGVSVLYWRAIRQRWRQWLIWGFVAASIGFAFWCCILLFNYQLTGDYLLAPRTIFSPLDRFGFGEPIGFYGKHTVAAGFVTVDELLTSLAITLFGWPFIFTLALVTVPFMRRQIQLADWFLLGGATSIIGVFVGFYYHGIYLGPRYLFEALPFLLILSARGSERLWEVGSTAGTWLYHAVRHTNAVPATAALGSGATVVVMVLLLTCSFFFYFPRQVALHANFTGMAANTHINLQQIYHPDMIQLGSQPAIVITNDVAIYEYVLFPLNDPQLDNHIIYAVAGTVQEYTELRTAYPQRVLYQLVIAPDGTVSYIPL